jgi:thiol:disulfide interchange protein DsbC
MTKLNIVLFRKHWLVILSLSMFLAFFLIVSQVMCDGCPSEKDLLEKIQPIVKREVEIKGIRPTAYKGLCEIHVRISGRDNIMYTNPDNDFFVFGHLIESKTGDNLTRKALEKYTKLSPKEVKNLKSYTAFSIGKGLVEVFYVTDPQCPYCKKGEAILKKLSEAGEIKTHFILYPLSFHKNAKEQCISIICDKKGIQGLESEYQSENQCASGKNKVEATILFMKEKGITGTPGYIFTDGIIHTGLLREPNLRERLGLPPPKPVKETPKPVKETPGSVKEKSKNAKKADDTNPPQKK